MKKLLLSASALAVTSLAIPTAQAEPTKLTISGTVAVAYSIVDQDVSTAGADGVDGDGIGFGNPSTQIIFDWAGATEAGLQYGARLDYRFQTNTTDEQYVYFGGNWGRLVFGGDDGVVNNNIPGGEAVLVGGAGYDGDHVAHTAAGNAAIAPGLANDTDDGMKFSYYSPSFSGVTLGASYIPNVNAGSNTTGSGVTNSGVNGVARGDNPQFEGTLAYAGTFDAVGLELGAGYAFQDGGDGFEDATGVKLGGTITVSAFSFGLGYANNGDTGCAVGAASCDGGNYWNAGLAYSFGPGGVSVGYMAGESSADGSKDTSDGLYLDADYMLAEGLQAFTGISFVEDKDTSAAVTNETTQFLMGTRVSF